MRELLKRALVALQDIGEEDLMMEIDAYLEKPVEPEPVAWQHPISKAVVVASKKIPGVTLEDFTIPLYAQPPVKREPVFLSDDAQYKLVNERYTTGGMDWGQAERLVKDVERAVLKANGIIE